MTRNSAIAAAFALLALISATVALPRHPFAIADNAVRSTQSRRTGTFSLQADVDVRGVAPAGRGQTAGRPIRGRATIRGNGDWTPGGPRASGRVNVTSRKSRALSVIADERTVFIKDAGSDKWQAYSKRTLSGAHGGFPPITPDSIARFDPTHIKALKKIDDGELDGQKVFRLRADLNVPELARSAVRTELRGERRRQMEAVVQATEGKARAVLWIDKKTSLLRRIDFQAGVRNPRAGIDKLIIDGRLDLSGFGKGVRIGRPERPVPGRLHEFPFNLENLIGAR